MKSCPNCGEELDEEMLTEGVCEHCGRPFEESDLVDDEEAEEDEDPKKEDDEDEDEEEAEEDDEDEDEEEEEGDGPPGKRKGGR